METDVTKNNDTDDKIKKSRIKMVASGLVPFVFMVILMAYIFGPGADMLDMGIPLPEVAIEQVSFVDSEIHVLVRNTGSISVDVVMADVNDRIHPAAIEPDGHLERYETATVRIPFEWNVAEPYAIGVTVGDGTRFERIIDAAAPAPEPTIELVGFFAVIGTYVGVIPVMIGLLWLPFIRRLNNNGGSKYVFFLALTAGLLLFLAFDSIEEAITISNENLASGFNGIMLVVTVVILSFLGLYQAGRKLAGTNNGTIVKPTAVALMIAIGIGLHNFGEGLAIGAAVGLGSIAFSTFLIVGFALHNITEGVAIATPISREKLAFYSVAALGLIAGSPAIFGAWLGGFSYSPITTVVFLAVGAGAIFQVMVVLLKWVHCGGYSATGNKDGTGGLMGTSFASGIAVGMLIMYLTSILV